METYNSKLEEILKIEPEELTPENQKMFLDILKESPLCMPIEMTSSPFGILKMLSGIDSGNKRTIEIQVYCNKQS